MATQAPICKVCNEGSLKAKKKYRLSGPAIVIGYILLIPSVLGMLFGLLMLFCTGSATSETSKTTQQEIKKQLAASNIPKQIVEKVINHETLNRDEKESLTQKQRTALADANLSYSAATIGTGAGAALAGGFSIFMIVASFVGGLIGWLLTMKKKVLQCLNCGAVVNAS